jgi:hypothetical protein
MQQNYGRNSIMNLNLIPEEETSLPAFFHHLIGAAMCLGALLGSSTLSTAQQKDIPLTRFYTQEAEREMLADSATRHSAFKPYLESTMDLTRITGYAKDSIPIYEKPKGLLLKYHLLSVRTDDYFLAIDPLFDFSVGKDFADLSPYSDTNNLVNNTRGMQMIGDIGKKFSFETSFYENQTFFPLYLKNYVDSFGVVPGMGRTKPYRITGYDYAIAYGHISYKPAEWLNLQFGHGKNFVGHGYRSLLLSDAAFNFPYLKATAWFFDKRLQYTSMYASLQTLERLPLGEVPEALFKRKGASFNYLSWIPVHGVELGLFEGVIWERYDSSGTRPQPWGAYIPVIGVNTALNGLDGKQNAVLGLNVKIKTTKHSFVYGQVAVDDPSIDAFGVQLGAKYFDLLVSNLDIQVEWNSMGDNLYASHYALQSYTHVNQPLGHPAGGAATEYVVIANYRWHRLITQLKFNHISHSTGPQGDWRTDPGVKYTNIAPWPVQTVQQWDFSVGLFINPRTNAQLLAGVTDRIDRTDYNWMDDTHSHTSFFYISLRTNLINRYADF